MSSKKTVALSGSEKQPLPDARIIAPAPPDERLEVTVRLRPRTPLPDASSLLQPSRDPAPIFTRQAYNARYGADPKDIARVRRFASANHLTVVRASAPRRSVMLSGTVADFNKAFNVDLHTYEYPGGTYRGRVGAIQVPAVLAPVVEGVFGLDNRPVARRHFRIGRSTARQSDGAQPFNPPDVAKAYNYPPGVDGTGQTVGIIELGGGYRAQDLQTYIAGLGLRTPTVVPVSVDGATNSPSGDPGSDDGEVGLDIEVVAAVAPGAKIVVYFGLHNSRTSKGFLGDADHEGRGIDDTNDPSVISISWGGPEAGPGNAFQTQFDQVLQSAAMLGVTVCIAAGVATGAADMGPNGWDGPRACRLSRGEPVCVSVRRDAPDHNSGGDLRRIGMESARGGHLCRRRTGWLVQCERRGSQRCVSHARLSECSAGAPVPQSQRL